MVTEEARISEIFAKPEIRVVKDVSVASPANPNSLPDSSFPFAASRADFFSIAKPGKPREYALIFKGLGILTKSSFYQLLTNIAPLPENYEQISGILADWRIYGARFRDKEAEIDMEINRRGEILLIKEGDIIPSPEGDLDSLHSKAFGPLWTSYGTHLPMFIDLFERPDALHDKTMRAMIGGFMPFEQAYQQFLDSQPDNIDPTTKLGEVYADLPILFGQNLYVHLHNDVLGKQFSMQQYTPQDTLKILSQMPVARRIRIIRHVLNLNFGYENLQQLGQYLGGNFYAGAVIRTKEGKLGYIPFVGVPFEASQSSASAEAVLSIQKVYKEFRVVGSVDYLGNYTLTPIEPGTLDSKDYIIPTLRWNEKRKLILNSEFKEPFPYEMTPHLRQIAKDDHLIFDPFRFSEVAGFAGLVYFLPDIRSGWKPYMDFHGNEYSEEQYANLLPRKRENVQRMMRAQTILRALLDQDKVMNHPFFDRITSLIEAKGERLS